MRGHPSQLWVPASPTVYVGISADSAPLVLTNAVLSLETVVLSAWKAASDVGNAEKSPLQGHFFQRVPR